jgi:hypothetical protein
MHPVWGAIFVPVVECKRGCLIYKSAVFDSIVAATNGIALVTALLATRKVSRVSDPQTRRQFTVFES